MDNWPRLSHDLPHPRHPEICQACGEGNTGPTDTEYWTLHRWREHDQQDRPEPIVIVLCTPCSDRLIERHPRLYDKLDNCQPIPGAMHLCVGCQHRDGLACRQPDLTANGGMGLQITYPKPSVIFMDGTRGGKRCGWTVTRYNGLPMACAGMEDIDNG